MCSGAHLCYLLSMSTITYWIIGAALCGVGMLALSLFAIAKRNMRAFWFAVLLLLVTVGCSAMAFYQFATKSYARISDMLEPRSGMEIYTALLGEPATDCVKVTAQRDQIVPKIDTGISLHMRTCPEEMARVLRAGEYTMARTASNSAARIQGGMDASGAFAPETLGDTVLTFHWEIDQMRNCRWIYTNLDSTEAICVDVLD